jgi:DNA-binding CsgD family transcriptional regulator
VRRIIGAHGKTPELLGPQRLQPYELGEPEHLTPRQLQVLNMVADGMVATEIAARLGVTRNTVLSHYRRIRWRLETQTVAHSVAVAFRRNLIT